MHAIPESGTEEPGDIPNLSPMPPPALHRESEEKYPLQSPDKDYHGELFALFFFFFTAEFHVVQAGLLKYFVDEDDLVSTSPALGL